MKKQKLNEQTPHKEVGVEKRRRFIKGAGLAAPVVLSLANRSAFGAAQGCLSQLVSGNMSQAGAGSCSLGSSVVSWNPTTPNIGTSKCNIALSSPQPSATSATYTATWTTGSGESGSTYILTAIVTQQGNKYNWYGTPYVYGILTTQTTTLSLTKKGETQSGSFTFPTTGVTTNPIGSNFFTMLFLSGTSMATGTSYQFINNPISGALTAGVLDIGSLSRSYFSGGTLCSAAFPNSSMANTSMLANLSPSSSLNAYKVCALLNAAYNPTPTPNPPYALTVAQVLGLCKIPSTVSLPPNTTLAAFLASTLGS